MHSNCFLPWPWLSLFSFISFSSTSLAVPLCHSVLSPCVSSPLLLWFGRGLSPKAHVFDHLVTSGDGVWGNCRYFERWGFALKSGSLKAGLLRFRALSHSLFHLCFLTSLDVSKHLLQQSHATLANTLPSYDGLYLLKQWDKIILLPHLLPFIRAFL